MTKDEVIEAIKKLIEGAENLAQWGITPDIRLGAANQVRSYKQSLELVEQLESI